MVESASLSFAFEPLHVIFFFRLRCFFFFVGEARAGRMCVWNACREGVVLLDMTMECSGISTALGEGDVGLECWIVL